MFTLASLASIAFVPTLGKMREYSTLRGSAPEYILVFASLLTKVEPLMVPEPDEAVVDDNETIRPVITLFSNLESLMFNDPPVASTIPYIAPDIFKNSVLSIFKVAVVDAI